MDSLAFTKRGDLDVPHGSSGWGTDPVFDGHWQSALSDLLKIDTRNPLETGRLSDLTAAQEQVAELALGVGFEVAHLAPAPAESLQRSYVPKTVQDAAEQFGPEFLDSQFNLVLRIGPPQPVERTLVINWHIDTVDGCWPASLEEGVFSGRGAVDDKGPGIAALAGVASAVRAQPELLDSMQIFVQSVAGEEGGAMGVYGTKALVDGGFVGRLNIFAEPTNGVYFNAATSTMTARVDVSGEGSTDDFPGDGVNATVLLSSICHSMARQLAGPFEGSGLKACIGGIHTGTMHNRVYGTGSLHMNFAYADEAKALFIESLVDEAFANALRDFEREFATTRLFARTATRALGNCRMTWVKKGLPALANRDSAMENILRRAGWMGCPAKNADEAFTCDAIWAQGPGRYAVVFGPGSLKTNHAHAEGEYITVGELEQYARQIAAVVREFGAHCSQSAGREEDR
jgi:acetylornithine deacetylase